MKIRNDLLHIASGVREDDGTKLDPEAQPAARVMEMSTPVDLNTGGSANNSINTQIIAESTAGELASALSHTCGQCKWFDNRSFQEAIRKSDHPAAPVEVRKTVNDIRAALLMTNNATMESRHVGMDGDTDVEAMMMACGFCKALTHHYREDIAVYPLASCPSEVRTPTNPNGYFEFANKGAAKAGDSVRDHILLRADGKVS